eukprot:1201121-Amphidinium_carterae.1
MGCTSTVCLNDKFSHILSSTHSNTPTYSIPPVHNAHTCQAFHDPSWLVAVTEIQTEKHAVGPSVTA